MSAGALWRRLRQAWATRPILVVVRVVGTLAVLGMLVFWGGAWTPDFLFVALFLLFALFGQAREYALGLGPMILFLIGPFVALVLAYGALRPLAPFLAPHVHYTTMISFDRWLTHGTVPGVWLQQHFYHGHLSWYDYYFYVLYNCHFLIPMLLAIVLWKRVPGDYRRFVVGFLLLSYAGFITYIAFPAAPPWMASMRGLIPPIHQIANQVWYAVGVQDFPSILQKVGANEVAAVPSLHAAYPMLTLLFVRRAFGGRAALAFLWYPVSMWIGIIYLGEHYVFDTLLGIMYAVVVYGVTNWLFDRRAARVHSSGSRSRPASAAVVAQSVGD